MRVLLIRPYFEMLRHELVFLPFESLGLQYLKSALLNSGHEVELYDCLAEHPSSIRYIKEKNLFHCGAEDSDIKNEIRKFKPDVVGISGMFYSQSNSFYRVADLTKSVSKDIIIIGGGAFPSSYKENILKENKNIDFIVIGEGEETAPELLNNLDNPERVKGICFRKNVSGEIVFTEPRPINMNLDKILFPSRDFSKIYNYSKPVGYNYSERFNLFRFLKSFILYYGLSTPGIRLFLAKIFNFGHRKKVKSFLIPSASIITSRGCPNRCGFCAIRYSMGEPYRMRSAENVLEEIDFLAENGIKSIFIADDNFAVSKERIMKICKGIIDKKYNIRISAPGVFIQTVDREVLEHLYKAGFRELQFGIENGDQEFLNKVIRKNLNLEQAKKIIKEAKEVGFYTRGSLIFGYPTETKETMLKTLRYAFESGVNAARFFIFQPFPGTEAFEMAKSMGAIKGDLDLSRLKVMTDTLQIETKDFTKEDVRKIHNLAYDILGKGNYEEIKDKIPKILGWE